MMNGNLLKAASVIVTIVLTAGVGSAGWFINEVYSNLEGEHKILRQEDRVLGGKIDFYSQEIQHANEKLTRMEARQEEIYRLLERIQRDLDRLRNR